MEDSPITPQTRYALLHNSGRKYCYLKRKIALCILFLSIGTFLILSAFLLSIGVYEKLVFPKHSSTKNVPEYWIRRATLYNQLHNYIKHKTIESPKKILQHNTSLDNYRLVCYYTIPAEKERTFNRELQAENIDPNLCTHIIIGFGAVKNNTAYLNDYQLNVSEGVIALKTYNKNLKVLLSLGGGDAPGEFAEMVLNHTNRKKFIKSIDELVRKHKFDGIDLDWEFPNREPHNDTKQKMHFTQLLHEIREEINRQDKHTFILSVAVAAPSFLIDISYDVSYMNDYVDFVNIMTYDFHYYTKYTPFTGINSPLYSKPEEETGFFSTLNINYTTNYWAANGMEKSKINIGLPTYGHSFKLVNAHNNGIGAPSNGFGKLGNSGFIDYNDVCWFLTKNQIKPYFDLDYKSPFATKQMEWISYDDQTSLTFKAEFIKNNNFGGAMVYALNTDDHKGLCNQNNYSPKLKRFPLTNTIKSILSSQQL